MQMSPRSPFHSSLYSPYMDHLFLVQTYLIMKKILLNDDIHFIKLSAEIITKNANSFPHSYRVELSFPHFTKWNIRNFLISLILSWIALNYFWSSIFSFFSIKATIPLLPHESQWSLDIHKKRTSLQPSMWCFQELLHYFCLTSS